MHPTALPSFAMALDQFLKKQNGSMILLTAGLLLAALGFVDFITGWELSVSLLYALIILLVAWRVGRGAAVVFAVLSGAIWCVANSGVNPYASRWAYGWATFTRLGYFIFVAIGGAALKAYRESNLARIEALERARALEHEITRASEREQRRIGQDLHDGICQSLAAIQFAVTSMREDVAQDRPEDAAALQEIAGMVKDAISETRDLARGIFPVQMEEAGLAAVLNELVVHLKRHHRMEAVFDLRGEAKISDPEVAMHLYRIAQEAVSNALKHGHPTRLVVSLHEKENGLEMGIFDNGKGMPDNATPSEGMGLRTMRHRANLIGATLEMKSVRDSGVSVICFLPRPLSPPHEPPH